jgi:hypothetical protein
LSTGSWDIMIPWNTRWIFSGRWGSPAFHSRISFGQELHNAIVSPLWNQGKESASPQIDNLDSNMKRWVACADAPARLLESRILVRMKSNSSISRLRKRHHKRAYFRPKSWRRRLLRFAQ